MKKDRWFSKFGQSLVVLFLSTSISLAQETPRLEWVSQMGGTGFNTGEHVAVDAAGNVYTTGSFWGTVDFDPGPGIVNLTSAGASDIFITKQAPSGALTWAVRMGGTGSDEGLSLASHIIMRLSETGKD